MSRKIDSIYENLFFFFFWQLIYIYIYIYKSKLILYIAVTVFMARGSLWQGNKFDSKLAALLQEGNRPDKFDGWWRWMKSSFQLGAPKISSANQDTPNFGIWPLVSVDELCRYYFGKQKFARIKFFFCFIIQEFGPHVVFDENYLTYTHTHTMITQLFDAPTFTVKNVPNFIKQTDNCY